MTAIDVVPPATAAPVHAGVSPHKAKRHLRDVLRWGAIVVGAAVATAAAVRYRSTQHTNPVHFDTARVDRGRIGAKVTATGALSALVTVNVGAQVSGRVDKLFVDFGSQVRRGQMVATLDPSFFRASVTQARANYLVAKAAVDKTLAQELQAKRQHTRTEALAHEGLVSRADLDAAEADLSAASATRTSAEAGVVQAKAALEQAQLNLQYTSIVSPIDGVVISRNVDVGQTVAAALQAPTLFLVAQDLTHMQVDTNVAEADVGKIRPGMEVTFTVDAYPDKSFHGVVRQVRDNAQTIQNVVTYDAVIDVDNSERFLKPGMTASVTFVYATRDNALRLPNAALRFKPDTATLSAMNLRTSNAAASGPPTAPEPTSKDERVVWVVRGGLASPKSIHVGVSDGSSTETIAGDLHEGDEAVVDASLNGSATKGSP